MTTTNHPPAPTQPRHVDPASGYPRAGTTSGASTVWLVVGLLLLVTGLIMAATGGLLRGIDEDWRRGGFLTSESIRLESPSHAIATEHLDMEDIGPGWPDDERLLGRVRVSVSGTDGQAVFVGIAPSDDVTAYLAGVRHATLTELADPSTAYTEHSGGSLTRNPAEETFWTASAAGTGTQHIDWPRQAGTWTVVVMNADASPNVAVVAEIGATVPVQQQVTIGLLIGSAPVVLIGGVLTVVGVRGLRRHRRFHSLAA